MRKSSRPKAIALRPIGEIDREVLFLLKDRLAETFSCEVGVVEPMGLPSYAYNARRRQYHSTPILSKLKTFHGASSFEKVLGIIDVDLYVPELNFVFGEASSSEGSAIISIHRLRQDWYGLPEDEGLFMERVAKEAVHELGHLSGLSHCQSSGCVMFFSNSLLDTDRKGSSFCPAHQQRLEMETKR